MVVQWVSSTSPDSRKLEPHSSNTSMNYIITTPTHLITPIDLLHSDHNLSYRPTSDPPDAFLFITTRPN